MNQQFAIGKMEGVRCEDWYEKMEREMREETIERHRRNNQEMVRMQCPSYVPFWAHVKDVNIQSILRAIEANYELMMGLEDRIPGEYWQVDVEKQFRIRLARCALNHARLCSKLLNTVCGKECTHLDNRPFFSLFDVDGCSDIDVNDFYPCRLEQIQQWICEFETNARTHDKVYRKNAVDFYIALQCTFDNFIDL